jgi:hypothetical protein
MNMSRSIHSIIGLLGLVVSISFVPIAPGEAKAIVTSDSAPTSMLVALTPCRLVDTRGAEPPMSLSVETLGKCEIPEAASSLSVVITVADSTSATGYLTAWSGIGSRPVISNLNWSKAHETRANSTLVELSSNGTFAIDLSSPSPVIVDVLAAFVPVQSSTSGRLVPIRPLRVIDTRRNTTTPDAGSTVSVLLPESFPVDTLAVAANITIVSSTGPGHVSVFPSGASPPNSSILNVDAVDQTRAAHVIVKVVNREMTVLTSVRANIIVDITGWFTGPSAQSSDAGLLITDRGHRVLDTRASGVIHDEGTITVPVEGAPTSAAAVFANVTMIDNADMGWVSVYPADTARPDTSTVNGSENIGTTANSAVVPLGVGGFTIYSSVRTHVAVDILGWFSGQPTPSNPKLAVQGNELRSMPIKPNCDRYPTGRAAIIDRVTQVAWLCRSGQAASGYIPFTAGPIEDAPKGEYRVYFKRHPWYGGGESLQRFTAFTRGNEGGRVAFHRFAGMPESAVGSEEYRNQSNGCFRLRTKDAIRVWNFLQLGDRVLVLNNA